jgi:predicted AAA+ superfamily ATPase
MDRLYTSAIAYHLKKYRQMAYIAGPRQVGKTTTSKMIAKTYPISYYLNWDNAEQRQLIMKGAHALAAHCGFDQLSSEKTLVVLDEIHKYRQWKLFLKGYFDLYEDQSRTVVTGSTKLDVYRRGGDSLMGRYFLYRMHPLSIAELLSTDLRQQEIIQPKKISSEKIQRLLTFGGFPEPYKQADVHFSNQWQRLRRQQLLKEDIRELSQIQDLAELEALMDILQADASQQVNVATIANQLNVAQTTVTRWINTLQAFYFCYTIKPWFKNVRRSIRKMPKLYLWDWSIIQDAGQKYENFIASHLLKAVHYWTDTGFGTYDLFYLRDKEKREVDFLVIKNQQPWFLVEVKKSKQDRISESLSYYQKELNVPHAFQVVMDMDYIDKDCFSYHQPVIVPASTFLSQLV